MVLVRLALIYALILFTSPIAGHALARAAVVGLGIEAHDDMETP